MEHLHQDYQLELLLFPHYVHTDENWTYAEKWPVDVATAINAPNGILNNNHTVLPNIDISQVIYCLKFIILQFFRRQQQMIFPIIWFFFGLGTSQCSSLLYLVLLGDFLI
jgi:hypothetical protein